MLAAMIGNALKTAWRLLFVLVFLLSIGFNITTAALGLAWTVAASVVEAVTGVPQPDSLAAKKKAEEKTAKRLVEAEKKVVRLEGDLKAAGKNTKRLGELEKANIRLEGDFKAASQKASKMEGAAIGKALQLERMTAEKAAIEAEMLALKRSKRIMFEGAEIALPEAVAKVTNRVKTRTAKLATADIGATFGQSIPWIGVAVVVAATGYDLKTSCDTMRDMHALEVAFNPDLANDPSVEEVCGLKVPTKEEIWNTVKASPGKAWDAAVQALGDLPDLPPAPSIDWPSMPDVDWTPWD